MSTCARSIVVAVVLGGVMTSVSIVGPTGRDVASAARVSATKTFGRSVEGRSLKVVNVGARSHETRVLVVGCIHGTERAGKAVIGRLRRMPSPDGYELWLIWAVNPDGCDARTRQNARGVDLNRNFPAGWQAAGAPWDTYYPGPSAASEPETRAVMRLVKDIEPDVTIWYHQQMALVTKMRRHLRVQRLYADLVGLPLERLEPLPGTATRWQNHRYPGHLSFVVELPGGAMKAAEVRRHARAVRSVGRSWERLR
ncbi:MAG TPA: DUF2817 domain-containing protein [Actinomycetota bacterium]|nr:DUF2817 domain-containing protein [Actinomycetota bacterium]